MLELIKKLKEKKKTISSCESLTGGMFASELVNISGASEVFVGALVTYQDFAKDKLLNGKETLSKYGAISKEMALLMALKVKEQFESDISISFTGNAGPTVAENKKAGLVYSCILIDDEVYEYQDIYQGNRQEVRKQCLDAAKKRLLNILK